MERKYGILSQLSKNQKAKIYSIDAGRGLKRRLIDMGLRKESLVKKLNHGPCPTIIELNNARIVLGRGIANKIMVEYYNE